MIIGVPVEGAAREKRTALTPQVASLLRSWGNEVRVERGTGVASGFADADYEAQGAVLSDQRVWHEAEVILKVTPPSQAELEQDAGTRNSDRLFQATKQSGHAGYRGTA